MRIVIVATGLAAIAACQSGSTYGELVVQTISAQWPGAPLEGIRVQVNDSAWATTDAYGNATFRNVGRPFTVRTYMTYQGAALYHRVVELPGLDANPATVSLNNQHYDSNDATISGAVTNGSGEPGSVVQVFAVHPGGRYYRSQAATDGTFQFHTNWEGATSSGFVVHALESDAADPPTHYTGYGSSAVAVSNGGALTAVTVQLRSVAETRVSGTVAVASPLANGAFERSLWLEFPDRSAFPLVRSFAAPPGLPGAFEYVAPVVAPSAAITFYFYGETGSSAAERQRVETAPGAPKTGLAFEMAAPVLLAEPPDGAGIGSGTTFRWSPGPDGASYDLLVSCPDRDGSNVTREMEWEIKTAATEARLPSVPFFTPTSGTACSWSVFWRRVALPSLVLLAPDKWSATASRAAIAR